MVKRPQTRAVRGLHTRRKLVFLTYVSGVFAHFPHFARQKIVERRADNGESIGTYPLSAPKLLSVSTRGLPEGFSSAQVKGERPAAFVVLRPTACVFREQLFIISCCLRIKTPLLL